MRGRIAVGIGCWTSNQWSPSVAHLRIFKSLEGSVLMIRATNLEDAVSQAVSLASSGDVVLFSPACASFDMFQNYHQRGLEFKRVVQELQ
jgi:UDP-N-acetylmuramoylalanine--D-glutamate ligase